MLQSIRYQSIYDDADDDEAQVLTDLNLLHVQSKAHPQQKFVVQERGEALLLWMLPIFNDKAEVDCFLDGEKIMVGKMKNYMMI